MRGQKLPSHCVSYFTFPFERILENLHCHPSMIYTSCEIQSETQEYQKVIKYCKLLQSLMFPLVSDTNCGLQEEPTILISRLALCTTMVQRRSSLSVS